MNPVEGERARRPRGRGLSFRRPFLFPLKKWRDKRSGSPPTRRHTSVFSTSCVLSISSQTQPNPNPPNPALVQKPALGQKWRRHSVRFCPPLPALPHPLPPSSPSSLSRSPAHNCNSTHHSPNKKKAQEYQFFFQPVSSKRRHGVPPPPLSPTPPLHCPGGGRRLAAQRGLELPPAAAGARFGPRRPGAAPRGPARAEGLGGFGRNG